MTVSTDTAVQLRGTAALVTVADKDTKRALNLEARRTLLPYVKAQIIAAAPNALARRVARSATIQTSRGFPYLKVTGKHPGITTKRTNLAGAVEFGAVGQVRIAYKARNPSGSGSHDVTRRTTRAFRPRAEQGKFIYPTAERVAPALAAAWLQIVEDLYQAQAASRG